MEKVDITLRVYTLLNIFVQYFFVLQRKHYSISSLCYKLINKGKCKRKKDDFLKRDIKMIKAFAWKHSI
jgi:hypothetical protein